MYNQISLYMLIILISLYSKSVSANVKHCIFYMYCIVYYMTVWTLAWPYRGLDQATRTSTTKNVSLETF